MRLLLLALPLLAATACFEETPCDRYVAYQCDCHADDAGVDCAELQRVYADADPALQDQCATDLTTLQNADDDAGLMCAADTGL